MINVFCLAVLILFGLFTHSSIKLLWGCKDRYNKKYYAYWENRNREDRNEAIIDRVFNALKGQI